MPKSYGATQGGFQLGVVEAHAFIHVSMIVFTIEIVGRAVRFGKVTVVIMDRIEPQSAMEIRLNKLAAGCRDNLQVPNVFMVHGVNFGEGDLQRTIADLHFTTEVIDRISR